MNAIHSYSIIPIFKQYLTVLNINTNSIFPRVTLVTFIVIHWLMILHVNDLQLRSLPLSHESANSWIGKPTEPVGNQFHDNSFQCYA